MRATSVMYGGMFTYDEFSLPSKVTKKSDLPSGSFYDKIKVFMADDDLVCSNVVYRGQKYQTNDVVVLDIEDCDNLCVGVIQCIILRSPNVYLVTTKARACRNLMQYFESGVHESTLFFTKADKGKVSVNTET